MNDAYLWLHFSTLQSQHLLDLEINSDGSSKKTLSCRLLSEDNIILTDNMTIKSVRLIISSTSARHMLRSRFKDEQDETVEAECFGSVAYLNPSKKIVIFVSVSPELFDTIFDNRHEIVYVKVQVSGQITIEENTDSIFWNGTELTIHSIKIDFNLKE